MNISDVPHGGDQTWSIWISRFWQFSRNNLKKNRKLFCVTGIPFTHVKSVWDFGNFQDSSKRVWYVVNSRENCLEILAVVIILSPISSVYGLSWMRDDLVECVTEAYKTYECVVSRKHVSVSHKSCQWYHHRDSILLRSSWIPRRCYYVCCSVPRSVRCSARCRPKPITQFVDRVTLLQYVL